MVRKYSVRAAKFLVLPNLQPGRVCPREGPKPGALSFLLEGSFRGNVKECDYLYWSTRGETSTAGRHPGELGRSYCPWTL